MYQLLETHHKFLEKMPQLQTKQKHSFHFFSKILFTFFKKYDLVVFTLFPKNNFLFFFLNLKKKIIAFVLKI